MSFLSNLNSGGRRRLGRVSSKVMVVVALVLLCLATDYYAHFVLRIEIVYTHLFYVPIVVTGLWWGKRAVWIAIFLGTWFIASDVVSQLDAPEIPQLLRLGMLIIVGVVVGTLREQSLKIEKELRETRDYLDRRTNELQKAQEELILKEKLASVGQLAAGVAHEINNPLGTILLFSDIMQKELPTDDPRHDDLQMIIDEATRCKTIVSDLLNFARQDEVLAQSTDVNALVSQTIEEIKIQPIFENVQIVPRLDPALSNIQADPAQLKEVFINIMTNAAEAMEAGGTLTITTEPGADEMIEIAFQDTGCGIPEENLGKIFTPFFTTKPIGKGIGLGLAIVYGIIKMHRGQIYVESEVGVGSTFTLTLPIKLPIAAAETTEGSETGQSSTAGPR